MKNMFIALVITLSATGLSAAEFYVSNSGDNSNSGSKQSPFKTITYGLEKLSPGDILWVEDGTYIENLRPAQSGTSNDWITLRAVNTGKVIVDGDGKDITLLIRSVGYWIVDGLKFQNAGENDVVSISSPDGQTPEGEFATHHIILRNSSIKGSCDDYNCDALGIGRASNVIVEDSWVYGFGRYSVSIYGSKNVTLRRSIIRWDNWHGSKYKPDDPRYALGLYNSHHNTVENVILLDSGKRPSGTSGDKGVVTLAGGDNGDTAPWVNSENNTLRGLILINNNGSCFDLEARVGSSPHADNSYENSIAIGCTDYGVVMGKNVKNTSFNHMTIIGNNGGLVSYSSSVKNTTVKNSVIAFNSESGFQESVNEDYNIVFSNSPNYKYASKGEHSLEIDPEITNSFGIDSAPLEENPGDDGKARGGHPLYKYVNGDETQSIIFPWKNEELIISDLCNPADLEILGRQGNNAPGLCISGKTLAEYIWEYYGNSNCPTSICEERMKPPKNIILKKN